MHVCAYIYVYVCICFCVCICICICICKCVFTCVYLCLCTLRGLESGLSETCFFTRKEIIMLQQGEFRENSGEGSFRYRRENRSLYLGMEANDPTNHLVTGSLRSSASPSNTSTILPWSDKPQRATALQQRCLCGRPVSPCGREEAADLSENPGCEMKEGSLPASARQHGPPSVSPHESRTWSPLSAMSWSCEAVARSEPPYLVYF